VAAILACARIAERIGARVGQAEGVIQLATNQQPAIGGDRTAAKLEQQTAVEIEPQRLATPFTHRVRHPWSRSISHKILNYNQESSRTHPKSPPYPGNGG
jgi:hypothetical protein